MKAELIFALPRSNVDYNYQSTPDFYAAAGQGGRTTLTAGKMLGGCHSLNHFYVLRGCPSDFDSWAEITGDNAWSYDNLLPYFKKSERLNDAEIIAAYPEYHGRVGPTGTTRQLPNKLKKYFNALAEVGHPTVLDLNANVIGFSIPQYTLDGGNRQTVAYTYLSLVKNNPNLFVSKNTRVTRIIFKGKVAVGVEAVYGGNTYTLCANKEIILSAGVFNTPQILMLSGVGPVDHLTNMGINVISNLPVGNTFTDQGAVTLVFKTERHNSIQLNTLGLDLDLSKVPFPVTIGSSAFNGSQLCPDYQAICLLFPYDTLLLTFICSDIFFFRNEICDRLQRQVKRRDSFYFFLTNMVPKSRGTIRLKSANPFDDPVITTGYLKNREDLDNMVKYVKDFIKIGDSTFFRQIGAKLVGLDLPECANLQNDEFWECYVRNMFCSPYHYTGTCPMGSVVDSNLKLIGFENIRIIDASVMPLPPKGAPSAAVLAIAERGADILKSDPCY